MCSKSAWLITLLLLYPMSYTHIISSSSSTSHLPLAQRDGPCSLYLQYTESLLQSKCSFHTFVLWSFRISFQGCLLSCAIHVLLLLHSTFPSLLHLLFKLSSKWTPLLRLFLQLGCSCLHHIGSQVFQLHCAV